MRGCWFVGSFDVHLMFIGVLPMVLYDIALTSHLTLKAGKDLMTCASLTATHDDSTSHKAKHHCTTT